MALLFDRDRSVISRHIKSIYNEGELSEKSTCAFFARVPSTRKRSYESIMYNLDVIISVGYRVNYGHIELMLAPDGDYQDAYVLDINKAVPSFSRVVIPLFGDWTISRSGSW